MSNTDTEARGEQPTTDIEPLLRQLREELAELDVPTERLEVEVTYQGSADCTCGVCEEEYQFKETDIVDPDEFDYDDWNTQAVDEFHAPLDQERLCWECKAQFVNNGGEFPEEKQGE